MKSFITIFILIVANLGWAASNSQSYPQCYGSQHVSQKTPYNLILTGFNNNTVRLIAQELKNDSLVSVQDYFNGQSFTVLNLSVNPQNLSFKQVNLEVYKKVQTLIKKYATSGTEWVLACNYVYRAL